MNDITILILPFIAIGTTLPFHQGSPILEQTTDLNDFGIILYALFHQVNL